MPKMFTTKFLNLCCLFKIARNVCELFCIALLAFETIHKRPINTQCAILVQRSDRFACSLVQTSNTSASIL